MTSRRPVGASTPSPGAAAASDGHVEGSTASTGGETSRPPLPLTPLMPTRSRTGSRDNNNYVPAIFRTPQQQQQNPTPPSRQSRNANRLRRGHSAGSSGSSPLSSQPSPYASRRSSPGQAAHAQTPLSDHTPTSQPTFRGGQNNNHHPNSVQYSRSYGSHGSHGSGGGPDSPSPTTSSMATPRRRGGGGSGGSHHPYMMSTPAHRSPSSPTANNSTSDQVDPYLEVPNLGHADNEIPLYYGGGGDGGRESFGLVPMYNNGGRSVNNVENDGAGHRHQYHHQQQHPPPSPGSSHNIAGSTDSHHGSLPCCSRKRTRRRAVACVAVVGLIGAQYLYAIQVGRAGGDGGNGTAVEAVAAAVSGAVNELLAGAATAVASTAASSGGGGGGGGGAIGGGSRKSIGDVIAGITSSLGGSNDASNDNPSSEDEGMKSSIVGARKDSVDITARRGQRSNATARAFRRKRVKKSEDQQIIETPAVPRLLFVVGSKGKPGSKKGRKDTAPLVDLVKSIMSHRSGERPSNSTLPTMLSSPRRKAGRKVQLYPAEQADETQLYPEIDSSDPPFNETMLVRSFPPRKGDYFMGSERDVGVGCHPVADWQSTFHPNCNSFHDIDAGAAMKDDKLSFLGAGHWRGAWSLQSAANDFPSTHATSKNNTRGRKDADNHKPIVYKTWSYEHRFEDFYYELNRIDAVAMERLTSSPYAVDIFGLCGLSSMTEFASEALTSVADSLGSVDKLKLVRKIAKGLSHVHGISSDSPHASLVHNDLNTAHILLASDGKTPLIHDFNVAQLLLLDNKEKPCGFASEHWSPQWRSPEEIRSFQSVEHEMLTEKVDIFALGNIIYRFLTGERAWRLGPGSMTEEYQSDIAKWKSEEGRTPSVPETVLKLREEDKFVDALLSIMDQCFSYNPNKRPSAKDIVRTIDRVLAGETSTR